MIARNEWNRRNRTRLPVAVVLHRRLRTSCPQARNALPVMVVGGVLLGCIPGIPHVSLDPDFIFVVVLPPLLYAAAWTTSWRDFRYNLVSIFLLAFGLVGFTVAAVALAAPRIFDGFDWRLGFVLGAVVAPTDAIAAVAIARRVGLPSRIADTIEGESLINDATGLLALQFGIAILVHKQVPAVSNGIPDPGTGSRPAGLDLVCSPACSSTISSAASTMARLRLRSAS